MRAFGGRIIGREMVRGTLRGKEREFLTSKLFCRREITVAGRHRGRVMKERGILASSVLCPERVFLVLSHLPPKLFGIDLSAMDNETISWQWTQW